MTQAMTWMTRGAGVVVGSRRVETHTAVQRLKWRRGGVEVWQHAGVLVWRRQINACVCTVLFDSSVGGDSRCAHEYGGCRSVLNGE